MQYVVSDVHGEYELLVRLLEKVKFSNADTLYVCGDMIDKGCHSVKTAKFLSGLTNARCILGNHELSFLRYYHCLMRETSDDVECVLQMLKRYFGEDGCFLDWDLLDWFENLDPYIEQKEFICVHAGIPVDSHGYLKDLGKVSVEELVNDRRFKEPSLVHKSPKCVFFGHTEVSSVSGSNYILGYKRPLKKEKTINNYFKIHLDTGAWRSGVLGCFCIEELNSVYVKKGN